MDSLFNLSPDDLTSKDLTNVASLETKIPIPSIDYLKNKNKIVKPDIKQGKLVKYEKEYDLFCRWAALPKDLREPPTAVAFEKKYSLPRNYTSNWFKQRDDYRNRMLTYFWEWFFDLYPDVVHSLYSAAVQKGNVKAASVFVELASKHIDVNKPQVKVQPMVLVGVPQEKIDQLFIPKDYGNIKDITPEPK